MSMDASDPPPLAVHRLRLLSDQPVEGCELVPDVFMLNGISPLSVRLEYKWYRCMDKMACSWCGKTPVVMQRLTDDTYFCSTQCFLNAWPGHQAQHRARACPCARASEPRQAWLGRVAANRPAPLTWAQQRRPLL